MTPHHKTTRINQTLKQLNTQHTLQILTTNNNTLIAYCTQCGHTQQFTKTNPQWGTTIRTWWQQHLNNPTQPENTTPKHTTKQDR